MTNLNRTSTYHYFAYVVCPKCSLNEQIFIVDCIKTDVYLNKGCNWMHDIIHIFCSPWLSSPYLEYKTFSAPLFLKINLNDRYGSFSLWSSLNVKTLLDIITKTFISFLIHFIYWFQYNENVSFFLNAFHSLVSISPWKEKDDRWKYENIKKKKKILNVSWRSYVTEVRAPSLMTSKRRDQWRHKMPSAKWPKFYSFSYGESLALYLFKINCT